MISNKKRAYDYRAEAKENLKNNWGLAVLVCMTALVVMFFTSNLLLLLGTLLVLFFAGQYEVGIAQYFIKLHNKDKAVYGDIFHRFTSDWIANFLTFLLKYLYLALWSMLCIIPVIIKNYSYAMTMYLKAKEPNLTANQAITKSRELMDGYKWKLFCLKFSFIGWAILSVLTLGIGFFFLAPYVEASCTAFFEDRYNSAKLVVEEKAEEHLDEVAQ